MRTWRLATPSVGRARADSDALFVWSAMHGLATILQSNVMERLDLRRATLAGAPQHVMRMIDLALQSPR